MINWLFSSFSNYLRLVCCIASLFKSIFAFLDYLKFIIPILLYRSGRLLRLGQKVCPFSGTAATAKNWTTSVHWSQESIGPDLRLLSRGHVYLRYVRQCKERKSNVRSLAWFDRFHWRLHLWWEQRPGGPPFQLDVQHYLPVHSESLWRFVLALWTERETLLLSLCWQLML